MTDSIKTDNSKVNAGLLARIAELERVNGELLKRLHSSYADKLAAIAKERKLWAREDLNGLAILKLEQQAKALSDAHNVIVKSKMFRSAARDYIVFRAAELRDQAKELREQGDDK